MMRQVKIDGPLVKPGPFGGFSSFFADRRMAFALARREILDRYTNQRVGAWWAIISPLIMMATYVVLFTTVFSARLPGDPRGKWAGVVYILSAMAPWLVTTEVLGRSASAAQSNKLLLRQPTMSPSLAPLKEVFVTLFPFTVTLTTVVVISAVMQPGAILGMLLLLPLAVVLQLMILVGLGYLLSAVGAFNRDTKDLVSIFTTIGLFIAPILYFPQFISHSKVLSMVIHANPFSYMVLTYRDAIFYGRITDPVSWGITAAFGIGLMICGYLVFARLSRRFLEVA